jgi:hypothetical protein
LKGIQIYSNKGPGPLQRVDNHKNVKMGWGHLKFFFSKTTRPILTRLGTHHPCRERIQVSLKDRDSPSPRGDGSERVKVHRNFLKNFLLQNQQAKINQLNLVQIILW